MSNKKIASLIALAIVIIGIVAIVRTKKSDNVITIGFVGPLSGGPALWGEGARNLVTLAVEEINADGGVNGTKINVMYEDGKCTSPDAVSALQRLKAADVKFVIGGHCGPETAGMVPLTKDGSQFMIAGLSSTDGAVSGSDFAFRTSPEVSDMAQRVNGVLGNRYHNVAIIMEQAASSKGFATDLENILKKNGANIVAHEEYKPGQTDFRTEITRMKSLSPDLIVVSPQSPVAGAALIKQMTELGLSAPIVGSPVLISTDVFAKSGKSPLLAGAFTAVPFADMNNTKTKALTEKYKARFNSDIPFSLYYVGASYDAVHMLANALRTCDDVDATTQCVADQFRALEYAGAIGNYKFKENGDAQNIRWATAKFAANGTVQTEEIK